MSCERVKLQDREGAREPTFHHTRREEVKGKEAQKSWRQDLRVDQVF